MEFINGIIDNFNPIVLDGLILLCVLLYLFITKIGVRRQHETLKNHAANNHTPRMPVPKPNNKIRVRGQSKDIVQGACGHSGPKWFYLNCYGADHVLSFGKNNCPDCLIQYLTRYVTRCSCCGLPIFPHGGVTLHDASTADLKYKDVSVNVGGSWYMGCIRSDCGTGGFSFAGYWTGDEFQPAITRYEQVPIEEQ